MSWDNEGRLAGWQNAPGSNPTSTTSNLYDGAGNRVEQQITSPAGNSSVTYVGGEEEIATSGSGTITTTYYSAGGHTLAEGVNGTFSFLASDGLGSALVALDGSSGNATASVLYDPYGRVRYTNGAMPGSRGFTNQHADSTTGLDDYGARYYDAVAGQFVSADSVSDGLNGYAYVHGNPETFTDPTGHRECYNDCGTSEAPAPSTNPPCTSNCPQQQCTSNCDTKGGSNANPGVTGGCDKECQRDKALDALDSQANAYLIIGGVLQLAGFLIGLKAESDLLKKLELMVGIIDALEIILPAIGKWTLDHHLSPGIDSNILKFTSVVQGIAGLIQVAIGWYMTAGWVMQTAVTAAEATSEAAVEGIEGAVFDLALQLLAGAATALLNGFSDMLFALANADFAEENTERNMNIDAWCSQYGGGCKG